MTPPLHKTAAVIGWPVAHSLSPRVHGFWLEKHGVDGNYIRLPAQPGELEHTLRACQCAGFAGVNLTVPHKELVLPLLDKMDDTVRKIGAANTIIFDGEKIIGRNTDAFGFAQNLKAARVDVSKRTAMVLGAGGAARAVVFALQEMGVGKIIISNRTHEKAEELRAAHGGNMCVVPWETKEDALTECGLLVNTTSLGMTGQPPLEISLDALPLHAVVTDIVYSPLATPLLKNATAHGLKTVDGLGMLLHQAAPGFAVWFGVQPMVDETLRAHVVAAL